MPHRLTIAAVLLFWLASMSWLVSTKILPPLLAGTPPETHPTLPDAGEDFAPVAWRLEWHGRPIGWAVTKAARRPDGTGEVQSFVQFEQLPVRDILGQLLGAAAPLLGPAFLGDEREISIAVASRSTYDPFDQLQSIHVKLDLPGMPGLLRVAGEVDDNQQLNLTAHTGPLPDEPQGETLYSQQLALPREALVSDAFSPSTRLAGLRIGQRWTFPVYRPFPPDQPVQIMEARVTGSETMEWNEEQVTVMVVEYREEAGTGLASNRDAVARLWVRPSGEVLRQELSFSSLRCTFTRMKHEDTAEYAFRMSERMP